VHTSVNKTIASLCLVEPISIFVNRAKES
jgi:hypothetical protein